MMEGGRDTNIIIQKSKFRAIRFTKRLDKTSEDKSDISKLKKIKMNRSQRKDSFSDLNHDNESQQINLEFDGTYKVYPERWWLLLTVVLLNLSNYSHWVAFPSVSKNAAKYYDQSGERMDLIPTVSYGLGVPCCLIATFFVEKYGLKTGLHIGGFLTGIGGLMCFLSTFPYLSDGLTNDGKFYLALVGQAMTGIACPFISCVPTKISQHWFGDDQRTMATIILGMSNPMGIVLGQGITPLLVREAHQVPIMNIVWFIPAGLGSILTMWKVKRNLPPSPPSPSAAAQSKSTDYWQNLKGLITNVPFIIMFLFLGGAMGYVSTISTKIEQILCARGYSDQLSGLSGSLILFCGFLASFIFGILAYKTGKLILICKISGIFVLVFLISIGYFFRIPYMELAIVASCALLGISALGVYPLALELVVECTYPIDQATPTALIFLSSSLQGVLLMEIENYLGSPLNNDEMQIQSCVSLTDTGHQQPKDYSNYLTFITVYMMTFVLIFMIFFRTELKRTKADQEMNQTCLPSKDMEKGNNGDIVRRQPEQEKLVTTVTESSSSYDSKTCSASSALFDSD